MLAVVEGAFISNSIGHRPIDGKLLQIVEMKKAHDDIPPLVEYLRLHVKGPVQVKNTRVMIEGAKHDEVKLLLHKYLHHRGLVGYKVHSQPDYLEIMPGEPKDNSEESKGRAPTAPETMPYFFPGR
jgi:hypothetical protein